MSDQSEQSGHEQAGHDHASQDEPVVEGGYGDPGEAEALTGDTDPETDPKAEPAEGNEPENPHGP